MASEQLDTVIRHLHRLVGRERDGLIGDGELLQRFVTHRDETAFEVLVWRHAALVLSVCRRILTCTQDVEDAFQATFLALVGEARRIVKTDSLAAWLHKVAYRVALKIKKRDR